VQICDQILFIQLQLSTSTDLLLYTVSKKNCAKLFLSQLRQISTDFNNVWQKDGKEVRIMGGALTFLL